MLLADAGYWHNEQMDDVDRQRRHGALPARGSNRQHQTRLERRPLRWMRDVLAAELGQQLYRRRKVMIEPVFGHMKYNRRFDRFRRRGRSAVRSEWRLQAATHNLIKLHSHRITADTT